MSSTYCLYPVSTSAQFRDGVRQLYPELDAKEHGDGHWHLMEYLLFSTFFCEKDPARIALPHDVVAEIFQKHPKTRGFTSGSCLYRFSDNVLPLNIKEHSYIWGRARTVAPVFHPCLQQLLRDEQRRKLSRGFDIQSDGDGNSDSENSIARDLQGQDFRSEKQTGDLSRAGSSYIGQVWFVSGLPTSRRSRRTADRMHEKAIQSHKNVIGVGHPAYALSQLLHRSKRTLVRVLTQNWPKVLQAIEALPEATPKQQRSKEWCLRICYQLRDFPQIQYGRCGGSPRIYAQHANVLQFPRDIRKIAFAGAYELDLCAAQLAIIARIWEVTPIQNFLESKGKFWSYMLQGNCLDPEFKPILKTTLYSLIFGMGKGGLMHALSTGEAHGMPGIGRYKARVILAHPFMSALLDARERISERIESEGGAMDAWGNWQPLGAINIDTSNALPGPASRQPDITLSKKSRNKRLCSFLACIAQGYELRLMSSIVPLLSHSQQIYPLAWLHDGITIHFGNVTKVDRQIAKLQKAVADEAERMGVCTELEVTRL